MAGGVVGGGIAVSALTVVGIVSPGAQLLATPVLFLLGAALGVLHGLMLAMAGRPHCVTFRAAVKFSLVAGLCCIPALAAAWLVTAGISLTAALIMEWRPSYAAVAGVGWMGGVALCAWAAVEGWPAVRRAYSRWSQGRIASVVMVVVAGGLATVLLRPWTGTWRTGLRLNSLGTVLLIVGAAWMVFYMALAVRFAFGRFLPGVGRGRAGP
jgi:hypothetical protein